MHRFVAVVLVVVWLAACATASSHHNVATIRAQCITDFLAVLPTADRQFMNLRQFVECARTAPMDAAIGYQIAKYAIYSRELHSLRQWMPSGTKQRFENILSLFASPTAFTSAAAGISELDFLRIIVNAFDSGMDLHFQVRITSILASSRVPRPIVLGSRVSSTGTQELFVRALSGVTSNIETYFASQSQYSAMPSGLGFSFSVFRQKVTAAVNTTVVKINGIPAMEWATRVMRGSFPLEDDGAAFNWALQENFLTSVLNLPPGLMNPTLYGGAALPWSDFYIKHASAMALDADSLYRDVYELADGSTINAPVLVEVRLPSWWRNAPDQSCTGNADPVDTARRRAATLPFGGVLATDTPALAMAQRTIVRAEAEYAQDSDPLDARRSDPFTFSDEESPNFAQHRVYQSSIANTYIVPRANGSNVIYIRFFTFYGSTVVDSIEAFAGAMGAAFDRLNSTAGMDTLVFDVFGNGGGYVALEEFIMAVFDFARFGAVAEPVNTTTPKNREQSYNRAKYRTPKAYRTVISSKTVFGAAAGAYVNSRLAASEYKRDISSKFTDDTMNNTQDATNGNRTYSYTSIASLTERFWYNAQGPAGSDYLTNLFENVQILVDQEGLENSTDWLEIKRLMKRLKNIYIVSDGFCASACAMFTTRLKQMHSDTVTVKTFTFGGIVASNEGAVEVSQTCGGSVKTMSCPGAAVRQESALTSSYQFPGRADFAARANYYPIEMTYNEYHFYPRRTDALPQQYQSQPGDVRVKVWEPTLAQRFEGVMHAKAANAAAARILPAGMALGVLMLLFCLVL